MINDQAQPDLESRLRGMIWGQFIGDAAALGAHWIYDLDELGKRFPGGVRGFEAPGEGAVHQGKEAGAFTHYGDAGVVVLESLAENGGGFSASVFGKRFLESFAESQYAGYRDHATKETIANFEASGESMEDFDFQAGADDVQMASAVSLTPIVAAHYQRRDSRFSEVVEEFTRVRQNRRVAVTYAIFQAELLSSLIYGSTSALAIASALDSVPIGDAVRGSLKRNVLGALVRLRQAHDDVTLEFGQACNVEQGLPIALHAWIAHGADFKTTILTILNAGGDNAARAAIAGGLIGAQGGLEAIPKDWKALVHAEAKIDGLLDALMSHWLS